MAILDTDLLLVNRPGDDATYKTTFATLKDNLPAGTIVAEDPPEGDVLQQGLLWFDSSIASLFIWYDDGDTAQWVDVYAGAVSGGENVPVYVGNNPPLNPVEGELWWNSTKGELYVYYDDGDSQQWVAASPGGTVGDGDGSVNGGANVIVSENPPTMRLDGSPLEEGDLWWNSDTVENGGGRMFVYYSDNWVDTSLPGAPGGEEGDGDGASVSVGENAPVGPSSGDLWWNSRDVVEGGGRLYVYYEGQWIDASIPGGSGGFSGDYNDLENKPNIPDGFDLEDGSEINNLIVWRSEGEALTLSTTGIDGLHSGGNITYTDMPTTATSGSGSGMTLTYDVDSSGNVSRPVVSFPGSGYEPGDTFTVVGRSFGGTISTTSSDPNDRPGPDGVSGWYPEPGEDYYVSTRVDSVLHSIPTFEAGFIGGRTIDDYVSDGRYNYFPVGNRSNTFHDHFAQATIVNSYLPTNRGAVAAHFRVFRREDDSSTTLRNSIQMELEYTRLFTNNADGTLEGEVIISQGGVQLRNANNVDAVTINQNSNGGFYFESPIYTYGFSLKNYGSELQITGGDDRVGIFTSASTTTGEYGIHHAADKTVSIKNSVGEIRLAGSGNATFFKGANSVSIVPGDNSAPGGSIQGNAKLYVKRAERADVVLRINSETLLELDSDDSTSYQTTYSTDDEGNQVENQEYIGTTETLLEIIRDLRARVTALEGN